MDSAASSTRDYDNHSYPTVRHTIGGGDDTTASQGPTVAGKQAEVKDGSLRNKVSTAFNQAMPSGDGAIPSLKGKKGQIERSFTLMNPFSKTAKTSSKVAAVAAIVLAVVGVALVGAGFGSGLGAPAGAVGLALVGAAAGLGIYALARKGIEAKNEEVAKKALHTGDQLVSLLDSLNDQEGKQTSPKNEALIRKQAAKVLKEINENILPMSKRLKDRISEFSDKLDSLQNTENKGEETEDIKEARELLNAERKKLTEDRNFLKAQIKVLNHLSQGMLPLEEDMQAFNEALGKASDASFYSGDTPFYQK
ncbi:MAG: hypothetical protein K0S07_1093 [Chlamydiales bacterium]|nr:hypothetical protein [Chlamydiales bacterium]